MYVILVGLSCSIGFAIDSRLAQTPRAMWLRFARASPHLHSSNFQPAPPLYKQTSPHPSVFREFANFLSFPLCLNTVKISALNHIHQSGNMKKYKTKKIIDCSSIDLPPCLSLCQSRVKQLYTGTICLTAQEFVIFC